MIVTFLGGPLDGETREFPESYHSSEFETRPRRQMAGRGGRPVVVEPDWSVCHVPAATGRERERYYLLHRAGGRPVYVHEDHPVARAFVGSPVDRGTDATCDVLTVRQCLACEVYWNGGEHCWSCGQRGEIAPDPRVGEWGCEP